jgi:hypothetical protein
MAVDLVIDIETTPGALAEVAAAIILVPHAGAVKHLLAISHLAVTPPACWRT